MLRPGAGFKSDIRWDASHRGDASNPLRATLGVSNTEFRQVSLYYEEFKLKQKLKAYTRIRAVSHCTVLSRHCIAFISVYSLPFHARNLTALEVCKR